ATEGQPPFGLSENTLSLLHAVAGGQINPPRQSGPLASVLAVMLHPEIAHRPTAEESEDLLAAVSRGETPLGGPNNDTARAGAGMGAAGAAAGIAGAGAAGAAAGALAGETDTDPTRVGPPDAFAASQDGDGVDGSHSGTLNGDRPAGGDTALQEDALEPGTGYPDRDYDLTHMMPYHDPGYVDDDQGTGYDDDYHPSDDDRGGDIPPETARDEEDEDDDRPGKWKVPAAIGAVTFAGLGRSEERRV